MQDLPNNTPAQAIVHLVANPRPFFGAIVRIPTNKPKDESYESLVCSEHDKACIHEIVTTLGEKGKFYLLFNQGHLKDLGTQVEHLHPLKFMSSIFSYQHLMSHMADIFDDYFKRTGFMDGLGPSLTLEAGRNKLNQYLDKFAQEINVPLEKMAPYFRSHDWEGLVEFLIDYKEKTHA